MTGATPLGRVHLVSSAAGTGTGTCPPQLGGACLPLLRPTLLATPTADDSGTATLSLRVPPSTPPGATLWLQAWLLDAPVAASAVEVGVVP